MSTWKFFLQNEPFDAAEGICSSEKRFHTQSTRHLSHEYESSGVSLAALQ